MSTYIVEVDSTFRDVNKYPIQSDFSVSFETNTSSDYFLQGVPLTQENPTDLNSTGTYYNNYFTPTSIDPDFIDNNLRVINGSLIDIQRSGNDFYLSGIAYSFPDASYSSLTGFSVNYGSQSLISFTGIFDASPYLCKLQLKVDNSFSAQWISYALRVQGPNGNFRPTCERSISRISSKNGIYWMFDSNYDAFNVETKYSTGTISYLYSITGPNRTLFPTVSYNTVIALDQTGLPYLTDNFPWGYHILYSNYNLRQVQENSNFGFIIDQSDNLILNTNLNKNIFTSLYPTTSFSRLAYNNLLGTNISRSVTGPTGSFTSLTGGTQVDFFVVSVGSAPFIGPPTLRFYWGSPTGLDSSFYGSQTFSTWYSATGLQNPNLVSWNVVNDKLFLISFPGLLSANKTGSFNGKGYAYEVDPLSRTITLRANTTTSLYNLAGSWSVSTGSLIYTPVVDWYNTLYIHRFDTSTYTWTQMSTAVLTGANFNNSFNFQSSGASETISYSVFNPSNGDKITIISPENNSSGNLSKRSCKVWISEYTISTNTLEVKSPGTILIYPGEFSYDFWISNYKNNRLLFCCLSGNSTVVDIIDITNPAIPVLYTIPNIGLSFSSVFIYTLVDNGVTHYYLYSYSPYKRLIYNIDDLSNIYQISSTVVDSGTQTYLKTINNQGICWVGISAPSSLIGRSRLLEPPSFTSQHVTQTYQTISPLNQYYSQINTIYVNAIPYIICSSNTTIAIYTPSSLIYSLTLVAQFSLSTPLQVNPYQVNVEYYYNFIYVILTNSLETLVYKINTQFTTCVLITTILPTVSTPFQCSCIYITPNALSPGLFIFVGQSVNNLLRKYQINENDTFVLQASVTLNFGSALRIFYYVVVSYNPLSNQYMCIPQSIQDFGGALGSRIVTYNATEPSQLVFLSGADNTANASLNMKMFYFTATLNSKRKQQVLGWSQAGPYYNIGGGRMSATTFASAGTVVSTVNISQPGYLPIPSSTVWFDSVKQVNLAAISVNGSFTGTDSIVIWNNNGVGNTDVTLESVYSSETLNIPGQIRSLTSYSVGFRNILVGLTQPVPTGPSNSFTGPSTLWIYDVSNPQKAIQSQNPVITQTSYSNLNAWGCAGILHSISYEGRPQWASIVGSNLDVRSGGSLSINSIDVDDFINLYVSGSWFNKVELFQTDLSSLTPTILPSRFVNQFTSTTPNYNNFIAKLRIDTGEWIWCSPIIGTKNSYIQRLRYNLANDFIGISMFYNSSNTLVYSRQVSFSPTGNYTSLSYGTPIFLFTNPTVSSSSVFTITPDCQPLWKTVLFSTVPNTYVNVSNLYIDESNTTDVRVIFSVLTNSTLAKGTDNLNQSIQDTFLAANPITQVSSVMYTFGSTGSYIGSNYIIFPQNAVIVNENVRSYADLNLTLNIPLIFPPQSAGNVLTYNKDGTLANQTSIVNLTPNVLLTRYQFDSLFQDTNGFKYSKATLYNFTGSSSILNTSLVNYNLFLLGNQEDALINKNFIVRNSFYNQTTKTFEITLNQTVSTNQLIRSYNIINGVTGSVNYLASNLSVSPLYDVGRYSSITGNNITFSTIYNHSMNIDTTKDYYFIFPQTTGSTGYYNSVVPISSITFNSTTDQYTFSVNNINDLRVPSPSGAFYGPFMYIVEKNYSAYYSLQWYPGARIYPQQYLVGLYDLIIPNRPIRNSRYPGQRFLTDYPYIYLVIYNSDGDNNFDPSVVNSVYDNNVVVPRFALFQIPTTTFGPVSSSNNYFSATSSSTPKIRFSPGYYQLSIKLTDDRGNTIIFDNTPYKETDNIFTGSVVPEELLNVTARLAFKRS